MSGAAGPIESPAVAGSTAESLAGNRSQRRYLGKITSSREGVVGLFLVGFLLLISLVGPLVVPHSIDEVVGRPYEPPSSSAWLGTDQLGRDVLSRFLSGGLSIIVVAFASTTTAYTIGSAVGLVAGFRKGIFDKTTIAIVNVVLSIPPLVIALLLLAGIGSGLGVAAVSIAVVLTPPIIRVVRSVTREIAQNEYVEVAVARGESTMSIVFREILPNIRAPLLADFGIRLSWAVVIFASLSFLGLGQAPPAADWGLMISENREGLTISPWPVMVPAVAIALLSVGVNLLADAVARSIGRTVIGREQ